MQKRIPCTRLALLSLTLLSLSVAAWADETNAAAPDVKSGTSERITAGLQALFVFTPDLVDQKRGVIPDVSGMTPALDVVVADPERVRWQPDGLTILGATKIRSLMPATRINEAIRASHALSVEAWIKPANNTQKGPARIVSLSNDPGNRNVTLGQDGGTFDIRLRTSSTSTNGIPSTTTPGSTVTTELTHIVFTRSTDGDVVVYVDGNAVHTATTEGQLNNWDMGYSIFLANEASGDRPWLGELHLVAIYSESLTADQVAQNFTAGSQVMQHVLAQLPEPVDRIVSFVQDVQPILRQHCFECHGTGNEEGKLNLGLQARVMEGGMHGPVLKVGHSELSPLIHRVAAIDSVQKANTVMPPDSEGLTDEEVGILRAWIDQGAEWPREADVPDPRMERARQHWAFQRLDHADSIMTMPADAHPIDFAVKRSLADRGLELNPPASRAKLIRRLYFDMLGLPPTPEQMSQWQQHDTSKLIDNLLSSPHFGERWGRHWLDVVRYADSDGQEADRDRPGAFFYRDFVVRAMNDDLPYDTFIKWQIAGDELAPDNPDALAATGFLTAGVHTVLADTFLEEERLQNKYNELDDVLSTLGSSMLGVTIGCARCHDHKYDAVSAREYYRMLSAFHSGNRTTKKIGDSDIEALIFNDTVSQPATTWLFERGDFYDRDQQVQLGFLDVVTEGMTTDDFEAAAKQAAVAHAAIRNDTTWQRAAMAAWLTDHEHGAGALLARVIVNRVWKHHFGEGLVRTVGDFGVRGDEPSHPALLDWLARDLIDHNWQLKRLHRLILTSQVYQQSAAFNVSKSQADPENRLLWRMTPRRQEAEVLRDSMLAVSGVLNDKQFGPGFKPPISSEAMIARNLQGEPYPSSAEETAEVMRRTVYMFHKRVIPYPLLQAFDRPDSLQSCTARSETTVAPQALAILNDAFVRARAFDFADRLLKQDNVSDADCVSQAIQLALARNATAPEISASVTFIESQVASRTARQTNTNAPQPAAGNQSAARRAAMADFCQALFGLNEFIYVD